MLVTPLQMTRFYAMIANGGKLVTPHIADDVELTGNDGQPVRILRKFGAQSPQPTGVDPTALTYVQRGLDEATHASFGTSSGVFGNFPVEIAGKTGSAEKNITLPGYPNPVEPDAVVVVRVRPVRRAVDRRLRRDRERRPRRHRGGARRAEGLRAVLQHVRANHDPRERLDEHRSRRYESARAPRPPRSREAVGATGLLFRLDWILLAAFAALVAFGLWAIDGITMHDPGGSALSRQAALRVGRRGALRRRPAHRSRRGTAMRGARSTSARWP